jgi:hypothetical protein
VQEGVTSLMRVADNVTSSEWTLPTMMNILKALIEAKAELNATDKVRTLRRNRPCEGTLIARGAPCGGGHACSPVAPRWTHPRSRPFPPSGGIIGFRQ